MSTGHLCHAHGCNVSVPPKMFMCKRHWFALPKPLRDAIWREYRPGQENDKNPSARYLAVQRRAIADLLAILPSGDRANEAPWPLIASLVETIESLRAEVEEVRGDVAAHCRQHGVQTVAQLAGLVQVYKEERDEAEDAAEEIVS